MQDYFNILEQMPADLRNPMVEFAEAIENRLRKEFAVTRQDITRLERIVAELAQDQKEARRELQELRESVDELRESVRELRASVSELRAAQAETAEIVNGLARETKELRAAQAETAEIVNGLARETKELRAAQAETAEIVNGLALETKELKAAQNENTQASKELRESLNQTAQIVRELAEARRRSDSHLARLDRTVQAVGARWGIHSEVSFREALSGILGDLGFEVERYLKQDSEGIVHGHPAQVELDVVIKDGKLILIEIKSSMSRSEVYTLERVAKFYEKHEDQKVDRKLIVCPFLKPGAMEAAERLGIEVFTDVDEVS